MHGYNYSKREPVDPTAVMGVRTYAQMGSKWIKKLNSENMQKEQFSEWGGEGRCRERRYADHMFIHIFFRMHHFVVKIFFASGGNGALTPLTKILRTPFSTAFRFPLHD